MESELVGLFEAAKKAADAAAAEDGGSEESRCLDALEQLKTFPVTYQLLVSTQVGKRLRPLTKHPRRKIQTFATSLIEIWKDIVIKETSKDIKNGKLEAKPSFKLESPKAESPRPEKFQRTSSGKVEKGTKAEPVKVEKVERNAAERKVQNDMTSSVQNVKVEKVTRDVKKSAVGASATPKLASMIKSNDAARDRVREMLHEALAKVSGEADEDIMDEVNACDPIRVAVTVESVLFENWGGSSGSQKAKYRSLMFNLKDAKNPDFRRRVLLGHVKPERLVDMSTAEMASDERRQENKKFEEKALFECQRGGPKEATTDQFKCGRCGKRKTTYYQMQTRSADEPMTTYVTCVNCNNRWKFC
ncbi:Transcription elongation factor [Trema orientale]|uniref:Transcription elongation factor n=1 Tax=Trema orientale TaxID=63057 RepID=A0A2P5BIH5_TREOI|nr:Transcription elongation factor [Trema orientale]